ncbi:MAG: hypothetical protein ACI837_000101 [Crocinitomicaceae bacterium]|jgi:hypothetical protein
MRICVTALLSICSFLTVAQTDVISLRSHAGEWFKIKSEQDNFGNPPNILSIDSVVYLGNECIIELRSCSQGSNESYYDTICEHPSFNSREFDMMRFKTEYPWNATYVGFGKLNWEGKRIKKDQSDAIVLAIVLSFLFLGYLFTPVYIKKKRERT